MANNKFNDKKLTTREDFLWGVNMHSSYYSPSYKVSTIEERINYAAKMGCKLMRLNANSPEDELDNVVRLCNSKGMKVMAVVDIKDIVLKPTSEELDDIKDKFTGIKNLIDQFFTLRHDLFFKSRINAKSCL